jgi:hypothetical protein
MNWIQFAPDRSPVAGCCEHGKEPLGYVEGEEFLDHLSDYQIINNDSTTWCHGVGWLCRQIMGIK